MNDISLDLKVGSVLQIDVLDRSLVMVMPLGVSWHEYQQFAPACTTSRRCVLD